MATLFGKLREHELELGRLIEEEEKRKNKYLAFKYEISKGKSHEKGDDSNC